VRLRALISSFLAAPMAAAPKFALVPTILTPLREPLCACPPERIA
jgi:hypothetical protein